jgi:hypothetical protein
LTDALQKDVKQKTSVKVNSLPEIVHEHVKGSADDVGTLEDVQAV